jgi:3',5'-cyclic-AMP phosphodiesterase
MVRKEIPVAWISRRSFLSAGAITLVMGRADAQAKMRWALLSDTHVPADPADVYRGFKAYENFKTIVPQVAAAPVEGALICGDLARLQGLPADYATLKQLMAPIAQKMPVAMAMGNHDDRKNFFSAFGSAPGQQNVTGKNVVIVEGSAVRMIVLDSMLAPNITPGQLGKDQRDWLLQFLASAPQRPTLVFVHHTFEGSDGSLVDAEKLFDIIKGFRSVKALVYGHSHVYRYDEWNGIHLINLPAVAFNFNDSQPIGWVESELTTEGGSFTLHATGGNKAQDGKTVSLRWRA